MTGRTLSFPIAARLVSTGLVVQLLIAAPAVAQSLGAVAKDEAARRKGVSSGKSYTNSNLKVEPPPSAPVAAPAAATPPAAPATNAPAAATPEATPAPADQKADDGKKDEAYWKKRLEDARQGLERSKMFAEALQSRINALTTDYARRDDPAQRNLIAIDRQKALAELERVKGEVKQFTKAIPDIQEEGRRAGVPAGWLR